jgi:hypothetical protein
LKIGDEDPDQWIVKKENVIGKAVLTIPYVGYLLFRKNTNRLHTTNYDTSQPNNHHRNKKHHKRTEKTEPRTPKRKTTIFVAKSPYIILLDN